MRHDQTHTGTATGTGLGQQDTGVSAMDQTDWNTGHSNTVVWAARAAWLDRGKGVTMMIGFWVGFVAGRMS